MIARLVRAADFERVLRTRSRAQSQHFALHHLNRAPETRPKPAAAVELLTGRCQVGISSVDDRLGAASGSLWLGAVVPKRHARRAVTRTLLKRQIRSVVTDHAAALPSGIWIVRLRAPFERASFVSASSVALKQAARVELDALVERVASAGPR